MDPRDYQIIRQLFNDYLRMYSTRDDRLTTYFSEDFSGFTGGGDFLVKNKEEWVAITRQDFAQVKDPLRIELKDLAIQSLTETIAVTTGFFAIHLPIEDHILSNETARLVLIFRKETSGWKISHSSISIPYHLVREGEIYPMKELVDRNQFLETQVTERTIQLSEANDNLHQTNEKLAREIAEHKQTEEALKNSLSLLGASLESTADGILIIDRKGKITRWNQKFAEMWRIPIVILSGGDEEQAINHILVQLTNPAQFLNRVRELYEDPAQSSFDKIEFIDGRVFERYSQPQQIEGTIVGRVWSFRDITDRSRAEAEKTKLETVNRQLQKAESLSRMAGAIAHHFNNQLGAVLGNLEMAIDDLPQNPRIVEMLNSAMEGAKKSVQISSLMLTYLGQTTGKHSPLDLSDSCRLSLPFLQTSVPKSILFNVDLPAPGPTISANENQLHQVLTNLVTNALEAVEENQGGIGLKVEVVSSVEIPATHRFPIGWQPQDSSYACVEIVDSGCGIREDNIEKLFDPFFSSKFTGRGLGLSVVLGIVKAHGGAVTVESKEGKGSTFRVFLPISAKEVLPDPDKTVQSLTKEEYGTVLLVEDEDIVRKMAEIMLTRLGFKVLLAKDGIEAVEIFRKHLDKISVVLSDLTMSRMNGWETLLKVRQIRPDIPIILTSGYDESVAINGTHPNLPYQVFLHKPYQKAALKDALDRALEGKLHLTPKRDTKDNTCRLP